MKLNIALLPGDGIGPEVTAQAVKVLKAIAMEFNHVFTFQKALVGASAIDSTGKNVTSVPMETPHQMFANTIVLKLNASRI